MSIGEAASFQERGFGARLSLSPPLNMFNTCLPRVAPWRRLL